MTKRLLAALVCAVLLMTLLPKTARAVGEIFTADGITYKVLTDPSGTTPGTVQVGDDTNGAVDRTVTSVTLPAEVTNGGNRYMVTHIGRDAFSSYANLTTVTMPDEVTSIGPHAFYYTEDLATVTMPGVTSIGMEAFFGCTHLTNMDLSKVTSIGEKAFHGCRALTLTDAYLPNLTSIEKEAFYSCASLTKVYLTAAGLVTIGIGAFEACTGLTDVTMRNVSSIGSSAFKGCSALKSVTILMPHAPTLGTDVFSGVSGCRIYIIEGATDFDSRWPLTQVLKTVEGTVYDADGNAVDGAAIRAEGLIATADVQGVYSVYVKRFLDSTITARIAGPSEKSITVRSVFDELFGQDICFGQVVKPTFSLADGTYSGTQSLALACATPGATIYYTTDGTEPTKASTLYKNTEAISVSSTATLKAKAFKDNFAESAVAEAVYTITPALPAYQIIRGQNGQWTKGSSSDLGFTADVDYQKFTGVSVDGAPLSSSDYTSQSGSTIVTLKTSYLETLAIGRHTLRVSFTDGYAETYFTVAAPPADVPKTGDNATPALWLSIALMACAGLAVSVGLRRRRENG